jgi:hypothetical protein
LGTREAIREFPFFREKKWREELYDDAQYYPALIRRRHGEDAIANKRDVRQTIAAKQKRRSHFQKA